MVKEGINVVQKTTIEKMDDDNVLQDSYAVIKTGFRPVNNLENQAKQKAKNAIKKAIIKKTVKKVSKTAVNTAVTTATTTAGTAAGTTAGPAGMVIGFAAGKLAGELQGYMMDKKDLKKAKKMRWMQLLQKKMGDEEEYNSDSFVKAGGSVFLQDLLFKAKYQMKFLKTILILGMPLLMAILIPVIIIIAVYNSPFAVLLPPTTDSTAFGYVDELYDDFEYKLRTELDKTEGYDFVERDGETNIREIKNEIISVYMVKYGYGDMAAEMNNKTKKRLSGVFDDMVRMKISEYSYDTEEVVVEISEDESVQEKVITKTIRVKKVTVVVKSADDMADEYNFSNKKIKDMRELLKEMGKGKKT